MALPAPVSEPRVKQEELGVIQLGDIAPVHSSSPGYTAEKDSWPLELAAKLLDRYRKREANFPDLDQIAASKNVELHCTPDLSSIKDYAPFAVSSMVIPSELYVNPQTPADKSKTANTRMGLLPSLERVWFAKGNTLYFWKYSNGVKTEDSVQSFDALPANIVSVDVVQPAHDVFVESVGHLLVITTTQNLHLYALSKPNDASNQNDFEIFDTELSIPAEGLGQKIIVRSTSSGRLFFTAENSGTSLWEVWYSNKESWFRAKTGKICHWGPGLGSGFLSSWLGSGSNNPNTKPIEHIVDMCIDESHGLLYTLTSASTINIFRIKEQATSRTTQVSYEQVLGQSRAVKALQTLDGFLHSAEHEIHNIEKVLHLYHPHQKVKDNDKGKATHVRSYTIDKIQSHLHTALAASAANDPELLQVVKSLKLVSIAALEEVESKNIRLVAVSSSGHRIYFRTGSLPTAFNSHARSHVIQAAYIHRMPTGEHPAPKQQSISPSSTSVGRVILGGTSLVNVVDGKIFLATLDSTRVRHQVDSGIMPSFAELSGWLPSIQGTVQDVNSIVSVAQGALVLTDRVLYQARRRPFMERLEQSDQPSVQLANAYGHMEICAAALAVATNPSTTLGKQQRENAIATYFRFGGLPVFRKDLDATRLTFLADPKAVIGTGLSGGSSSSAVGPLGVRLSALFDGLAIYTVRLLFGIWDAHILRKVPTGATSTSKDITVSNISLAHLQHIYKVLSGLVDFLHKNRSFSEGMSQRPQHSAASQMQMQLQISGLVDVNILTQAERRGLQVVSRLIESSQQGIAFLLLILTETGGTPNGIDTLLRYFSKENLKKFENMRFSEFFVQAKHSEVARELVTCLVNYVINRGDSIDSVARVIQDRCESYCSANDVLVYKALEYLHAAKAEGSEDLRAQSLHRSSELFRKAAPAIDIDGLHDIVAEYVHFGYYVGAVEVVLAVAAESDLANVAVGYIRDNKPKGDPREAIYAAKHRTYNVIFEDVLSKHPELVDASSSANATYQVMLASSDEVWHFAFYDWLLSTQRSDRLAQIQTPFVQPYLQLGAKTDLKAADLLWKWYQRRGDLLAAADVLLNVAKGELQVPMAKRVEFLSRAMGYCNCTYPDSLSPQVANLTTMVRSYLRIAVVQADILHEVQKDDSLDPDFKSRSIEKLNSKLLTVSELFNDYADPLNYGTVCLAIFELSDYRDAVEIRNCWQSLLDATRLEDELAATQHYAHIGSLITALGNRYYGHAEFLFPLDTLVPMLEQYAWEYCNDEVKSGGVGVAPTGWLVDAFINGGVSYSVLFEQLVKLRENKIYPFAESGPAKQVGDDIAYLLERWNSSDSDTMHSRVDVSSLAKLIGADEVARVLRVAS